MINPTIRFHASVYALLGSMLLWPHCQSPKARTRNENIFTPEGYKNYIIDRQSSILSSLLKLNEQIDALEADSVQFVYQNLLTVSDSAFLDISMLSAYDGDSLLVNQSRTLFRFYRNVFRKEYKRMIEIFMKQDNVTTDELHELSDLIQQIKNMERIHDSTFTSAITLFENKHIFISD